MADEGSCWCCCIGGLRWVDLVVRATDCVEDWIGSEERVETFNSMVLSTVLWSVDDGRGWTRASMI